MSRTEAALIVEQKETVYGNTIILFPLPILSSLFLLFRNSLVFHL